MLIILSVAYALLVIADVGISLWAIRYGKAHEANVLLRRLMPAPLILAEIVLYALVIVAASYFWPILAFAILWRGMILVNNIQVVKRKC